MFLQAQIVFDRFVIVNHENCEIDIYRDCIPSDECIVESDTIEHVDQWGSRLSAPGYMDRTDWNLYDTEKEAKEGLADIYDLCPSCLKDECTCEREDN